MFSSNFILFYIAAWSAYAAFTPPNVPSLLGNLTPCEVSSSFVSTLKLELTLYCFVSSSVRRCMPRGLERARCSRLRSAILGWYDVPPRAPSLLVGNAGILLTHVRLPEKAGDVYKPSHLEDRGLLLQHIYLQHIHKEISLPSPSPKPLLHLSDYFPSHLSKCPS